MASNINHPGVDTASTGWAEGQTGQLPPTLAPVTMVVITSFPVSTATKDVSRGILYNIPFSTIFPLITLKISLENLK
jgi:hypothetical protein